MTDQPSSTAPAATPMGSDSITGLILAGGLARRMRVQEGVGEGGPPMLAQCRADWQGWDKGLVLLDGEPLVQHARRFLAPRTARLLISANRYLDLYARYGDVCPDDADLGEAQGPLAGVASALARVHTPWLAVMPVDVPHPPDDLFTRLGAGLSSDGRARVAFASTRQGDAGRDQPLCMLLHAGLQEDLRSFLQGGERRVMSWLERNRALRVCFEGGEDAFRNINTPSDLTRGQTPYGV